MAFSAKQFSLFLLVALFSSLHTHARDSQFFNKLPSTTNDVAVPINKEALNNQHEDPTFLPEKDNGYGLYGHESGQNPPSTTTTTTATAAATTPYSAEFKQPAHKYLPKNYNPVAYVTQPEDINDNFSEEKSFSTNANNNRNNYYNGGAQNYYNNQQREEEEEEKEFRNYPAKSTNKNNNANYYYSGGSSFNSDPQPQGLSETRYRGGATRNGGRFQPQGMSDTRFLENGKYFYDVEAEKYSNNHPYENLKGVRTSSEYNYNRNFYGNAENNAYGNSQEEFQDDESLP